MWAPWSSMLVDSLVDWSVRSLFVAAIAGLVLTVLRISDTNIRHRTWTIVLAAMLAVPMLGWALPALESSIVPAMLKNSVVVPMWGNLTDRAITDRPARVSKQTSTAAPDVALQAPVTMSGASSVSRAIVESQASQTVPWALILAVAYLIVAATLFARILVGVILTRRMVRRGQRLTSEDHAAFRDDFTVVATNEICTVATVGIWRPVILLPSDWWSWSTESLRLAIAHEAFHIRRRDALVNLAANVNVALYWFNPLAWFLRKRLADLAEQVCDDEVLRTHGDHASYAETLLAMASRLAGSEKVSPLVVPMARHSQVESRIDAIIDEARPLCRRMGVRGLAVLLAIAVPLVVYVAALEPASSAPAAEADADVINFSETAQAKPAEIVAGRVISDADGSAISGAEVRLTGWNENRTRYDVRTVVTSDEGKFQFDNLPGGALQVIALYKDLASRTARYQGLKVMPGEETIELRMKPVPALRVKVVDKATERPLSGAMVRLTWTDGQRDHKTDDDGEVVIRGLTPELWTIEVFADGYAEREEAIQLSGVGTTAITAALNPGFAIEGVVVDEQQRPLEGVGISIFPGDFNGQQIEYLETDSQGKYRFAYLPLMGLKVLLSKDGYVDERFDVAPQVAAGETQQFDITLPKRPNGGFVEGTVVDSEGRAIAGAKVINVGRSSRDVRETTTDADGRFRVDDVFKGVEGYVLVVKSPGYAPAIYDFSPGATRLDVVLKPGHRVRGRVVDEQGNPLAGLYVGYRGQIGMGGSTGDGSHVVTEPDGKFQFDMLPQDAKFEIRPYDSRAAGYSPLADYTLPLTLPLDGDDEVVVTLESEGVIRGRVVDAVSGAPVTTFVGRVTFSPDRTNDDPIATLSGPRATGEGETFVSPQGEFRMGKFARGMPLQVTIEAKGYERAVMRRVVARPESKAEPVEFRLRPIEKGELQTFAGQVVDQSGKGVGGTELRLIVADERRAVPRDKFPFNWQMIRTGQLGKVAEVKQFLTTTTDRDGRFEFRGALAGGDIELAYWGAGVSQGRLPKLEELDETKRQNLLIEIVATGTVVGKIDRERFPRLDQVALSGMEDFFHGQLNEEGSTYRIENVPPGSYELQLYRYQRNEGSALLGTDVLHRERVEVKSGETTVVDIAVGDRDSK